MNTHQVFVRWLREHPALDLIQYANIPRHAKTYVGWVVTLTRSKDL